MRAAPARAVRTVARIGTAAMVEEGSRRMAGEARIWPEHRARRSPRAQTAKERQIAPRVRHGRPRTGRSACVDASRVTRAAGRSPEFRRSGDRHGLRRDALQPRPRRSGLNPGRRHVESDPCVGCEPRAGRVHGEHGPGPRRDVGWHRNGDWDRDRSGNRRRDRERSGHGHGHGHGHGGRRGRGRGRRIRRPHRPALRDGELPASLSGRGELRLRLQRRQLRSDLRRGRELYDQLQRRELPAELRGERQLQPRLLGRQLRSVVRWAVHDELLRQELPLSEFSPTRAAARLRSPM